MARYELLEEFGTEDDVVSVSPNWVIAVYRYTHPLTFSRAKLVEAKHNTHNQSVSFDPDNSVLTKTSPVLIISDDCVNMSINANKGNHCQQLQAVLVNSGFNYMSEILPGDWVVAWIVNSEEMRKDLIDRIRKNEICNHFDDGLKFVGRVHDMRKTLVQSPDGLRTVQFNMSCTGFSELDSQIFYDPHLGMREPSIGQYLARLNIQISDVFSFAAKEAQKGKGGIDSNLVIPVLIRVLIGEGIPNDFANRGKLALAQGLTNTDEAPYAYQVPGEIGKILGVYVPSRKSGVYSYADILELVQGLQKYSNESFPSMFIPDGAELATLDNPLKQPNRHFTGYPLKGSFLPMPVDFTGKSVWSLLNEYLNPTINEMYTAMKMGPHGRVMPTLVVRQLPFSSPVLTNALKTEVTSFLELPRWSANPVLVRSMDIGRSDSTRFNFVHVYGQASAPGLSITEQIVRNPPIRDEQDIKRHGLRPFMQTVNCSIQDTVAGPREWMTIISDIVMGQQLTLTGHASLVGITAPICPGDNFEFEDVVYHIESVTHSCSISPDGRKEFTTQLQLTHGVRSDLPIAVEKIPTKTSTVFVSREPNLLAAEKLKKVQTLLSNAKSQRTRDAIYSTYGGKDSINAAIAKAELGVDGFDVIGDNQQNPDLYMYSGIDPRDNTAFHPGHTDEGSDE